MNQENTLSTEQMGRKYQPGGNEMEGNLAILDWPIYIRKHWATGLPRKHFEKD